VLKIPTEIPTNQHQYMVYQYRYRPSCQYQNGIQLNTKPPKNATKRHETPQNAAKCHKTPQNTTKRHKTPQNAKKCHKTPHTFVAQICGVNACTVTSL
jgi:hypothetical protein